MVKHENNKDFNGFRIVNVIVLSLIFIIISCDLVLLQDDELTIKKAPYSGNELNIDGYYYQMIDSEIIEVYFFFKNGVLLSGGDQLIVEMPKIEERYINGSWYKKVKNDKLYWGVFKIDSNKIQYQTWVSAEVLPAYTSSGIILNDTTFKIIETVRVNGTDSGKRDMTYHFKSLSPKPDSTNDFIK